MLKLELGLREIELNIATEVGADDAVGWHADDRIFDVGGVRGASATDGGQCEEQRTGL